MCLAADSMGKQGHGKGKMKEHWSLALVQSYDVAGMCICIWSHSDFMQESQSKRSMATYEIVRMDSTQISQAETIQYTKHSSPSCYPVIF